MAARTALIVGATGATGKPLLSALLSSPAFSLIGEFGRRVSPLDQLPQSGRDKLQQKTIDFEKLEDSGLKGGNWDVVYITLGTTKAAAGSAANFEKIDREYVINAARAAKSEDPSKKQRLVYLSASGADSSSSFLYTKSKGLTEDGLKALGYDDTIVFRPGMLLGADDNRKERGDQRLAERIFVPLAGLVSKFSSNVASDVSELAKSMLAAGSVGTAGIPSSAGVTTIPGAVPGSTFTIVSNAAVSPIASL